MYSQADRLAETQGETYDDRLDIVEIVALVDTLADILA